MVSDDGRGSPRVPVKRHLRPTDVPRCGAWSPPTPDRRCAGWFPARWSVRLRQSDRDGWSGNPGMDRVRRELRVGPGDANRYGHRHDRHTDRRRQRTTGRSPSRRTEGPPTCQTGTRTRSHRSTRSRTRRVHQFRSGSLPEGIAIAPNGKTAYVTNAFSNTVTPINIPANTTQPSIPVGSDPAGIAITPNGDTAYVADLGLEQRDSD